ncbi:MAG TPA: fibronectin type III domain-containing protein [Candidatus Polarisedimenticolia bacterium]|nr:fibronectin type III domain-containing protein [Candidatus Polarisedimenticolia bacterium]
MGSNWKRHLLIWFAVPGSLLGCGLWQGSAAWAATEVILSWDANSESDLAGYRIRYGTSPGNHSMGVVQVPAGTTTTAITGLNAGLTYYFAAHAFDYANNESFPSNEIPAVPVTVAGAILTLSLSDSPDPVAAGGNITYTLDYANTGDRDATGVTIISTIPANTSFISAANGGSRSGSTVTWAIGSLPPGVSNSVQMTVRVNSPLANGTSIVNNGSSIDSSQTSPVTAATVTTTVTSAPVLSIAVSDAPDPVVAGNLLAYTFNYANSGNANTTGAVITATVPANTTFNYSTGGGTYSSGVVTWSLGSLNAGASGIVQLVVLVSSGAAGTTISSGSFAIDSDQTSPVSGAPAITTVTAAPSPTISNALEQGTSSMFVLQSGRHDIVVTGTNFINIATLSLGSGITINSTTVNSSTRIVADITVAANATLGGRTVTVTNPGGGTANKVAGLEVIKTTDVNEDCRIDSYDLNVIAHAYGSAAGDANYTASADLDGDGAVDGVDITLWSAYFGQPLQVCP